MRRKPSRGFTLIEIMIVATILAILAMIALPKFADMVERSREAAAKGKLGSVRSAITLYYADTEGLYPIYIYELTNGGRYLDAMPSFSLLRNMNGGVFHTAAPGNFLSGIQGVNPTPTFASWQTATATSLAASAHMSPLYTVYNPGVYANYYFYCTHLDSKGVPYTTY